MKRASYKNAINFIAFNDGWGDKLALDPNYVRGFVSVILISKIFDIKPEKVALDVVKLRLKAESSEL